MARSGRLGLRPMVFTFVVAATSVTGCTDESYGTAGLAVPGRPVEVFLAKDDTAWLGRPSQLDAAGATIAISDVFRSAVHLVDRESGTRRLLGRQGTGPGEFQAPYAVSFMGDELWVTDIGTHRLSRFTTDGTTLLETVQLRMPLTVAMDDRGRPVSQSADPDYLIEVVDSSGFVPLGEMASLPDALREQSLGARMQPNFVHLEALGRGKFVVAENQSGTLWVAKISNGALDLSEIVLPPRLRRELQEQKQSLDGVFEGAWTPIYQSLHAADSTRVWLRTSSTELWGFVVNTRNRQVELLVRVNPDERIPMIDSLVRGDTLFILTDNGVRGRLLERGP